MALPRLKAPPAVKQGPKYLGGEPERVAGGYGEPPPGFVTIKTTATEWPVYWGLAKIFGTPRDPRKPPFSGGSPIWTYQAYVEAGGEKSSNLDFVVWNPGPKGKPIGLRVQTEYRHLFGGSAIETYDIIHRQRLEGGFLVIDLFDFEWIRDKSGAAVIVRLKEAMGLIESVNPIWSGAIERV